MKHIVRVITNGVEKKIGAEHGENLLKLLQNNSININSPCAGNGTCGKCRVKVEGMTEEISLHEEQKLGEKAIEKGYRLACSSVVKNDITVFLQDEISKAAVMIYGKERSINLNPIIKKTFLKLNKPDLSDQQAYAEKIVETMNKHAGTGQSFKTVDISPDIKMDIMRSLPAMLSNNDYEVTVVNFIDNIIRVEAGDTSQKAFGIAIDIGTTTIAGYLINLMDGSRIDTYSCLNPQKAFGADVISRINCTINSEKALEELNVLVVSCINSMIDYFADRNRIDANNIYAAVIAGNTTMLHFLMKLPAQSMAVAPFIPVTTEMQHIRAGQLGINISTHSCIVVLPAVSAYVGGDTVAAVLSSGMYEDEKISLLLDLGTNGEIVLGSSKWMYSCSAAAGPAFEGANIRNGVAGVRGAIDKVSLEPVLNYTTIDNAKAIGICGSGIVDAVAAMLEIGIIDETGRILDDDEFENKTALRYIERIIDTDGQNSFMIASSDECACDTGIIITQKDIRELQNAKAAIAAGVRILVKEAGIEMKNIDKVYLAGGFGSYINIDSAVKIGLLPDELTGRIESIGNAAGIGAVQVLLSQKLLKKTKMIKEKIKYVELSARTDFMDEYVECMMFG